MRKGLNAERRKTYHAWQSMRQRCLNPTNHSFHRYGKRGITVCERWVSFEAFLSDMGDAPKGMSLERIDNQKGYYPSNCRWATPKEQNRNMRTTILVTFKGQTLCATDWAEKLGTTYQALYEYARYHNSHLKEVILQRLRSTNG